MIVNRLNYGWCKSMGYSYVLIAMISDYPSDIVQFNYVLGKSRKTLEIVNKNKFDGRADVFTLKQAILYYPDLFTNY